MRISTYEIWQGVSRCCARLNGSMPMGIMNECLVKQALMEYMQELNKRKQYLIN